MFTGSNWTEYSEFEFAWLSIMLEKPGILLPADIRDLAARFQITFSLPVTTIDPTELGRALLADISRVKLLPVVQDLVAAEYPNMIDFSEAADAYQVLLKASATFLIELLKRLPLKPQTYALAKPKAGDLIGVIEPVPEQLRHLALEGLCRLPAIVARDLLRRKR